MTRDFELVRQMLMRTEEGGNRTQFGCAFGVTTVAQHLEWMMEANLVRGEVHRTSIGVDKGNPQMPRKGLGVAAPRKKRRWKHF